MNTPIHQQISPVARASTQHGARFFTFDDTDDEEQRLGDGSIIGHRLGDNDVPSPRSKEEEKMAPEHVTSAWEPAMTLEDMMGDQGLMNYGFGYSAPSPIVHPEPAIPESTVSLPPVKLRAPKMTGRYTLPAQKRKAVKATKAVKHVVSKHRRLRQPWSVPEDSKLLAILRQSGGKVSKKLEDIVTAEVDWNRVAKKISSNRTAKQCRDRWINFLRPGLKKGDWSKEEEEKINLYVQQLGQKWSYMATKMQHRSENDIKNKWYSMQRQKERVQQAPAPSKCDPFASDSESEDDI